MSQNASNEIRKRLLADGPQLAHQLVDRISIPPEGVTKFDPYEGHGERKTNEEGRAPIVYYIDGVHEPETVVSLWLDAFGEARQETSDWALHKRFADYGEAWKSASRELLGPFDKNGKGSDTAGGTCDICGEDYDCEFGNHLRNCEGLQGG